MGSERRPAAVGVVLAGGLSRRMGEDKALLVLAGETLVARAARALGEVAAEVAVADAGRGYLPELPSLADGPGGGPAAGLLGAATAYPGRPLLALACDLPFLPVSLLAHLAGLGESGAWDLALPRSPNGLEPLAALYGPAALAALRRRVEEGRFALHELADDGGLRVRVVVGEELRRFGDPARMLHNLNRPGDRVP